MKIVFIIYGSIYDVDIYFYYKYKKEKLKKFIDVKNKLWAIIVNIF